MTATPAQRAVAAAHLLLLCAAFAGLAPVAGRLEYRAFGIVEGLFALLLTYVLLLRGVWAVPPGVVGWVALVYGTLATAQVAEFLFPPPGLIEWAVVAALAISGLNVFARSTRRRMVFALASLALLLAVLKYSVLPVFWELGPDKGSWIGIGDAAEGARQAFASGEPVRPIGQLLGFVGIACWALATRLLWPDRPPRRRRRRPTALGPAASRPGREIAAAEPSDRTLLAPPRRHPSEPSRD